MLPTCRGAVRTTGKLWLSHEILLWSLQRRNYGTRASHWNMEDYPTELIRLDITTVTTLSCD